MIGKIRKQMNIVHAKKLAMYLLAIVLIATQIAWPIDKASAAPASEILVTPYSGPDTTENFKSIAYTEGTGDRYGYLIATDDGALWREFRDPFNVTNETWSKSSEVVNGVVDVRAGLGDKSFYALKSNSEIWKWTVVQESLATCVLVVEESCNTLVGESFNVTSGLFGEGIYVVTGIKDDNETPAKAVLHYSMSGFADTIDLTDATNLSPNKIDAVQQTKLVIIGDGGSLFHTTGEYLYAWNELDLPETANYVDIAGEDSSKPLVVVADDSTKIYYGQLNGEAWSSAEIDYNTSNLKSVAFGAGYYIAVGEEGSAFFSKDGVNWAGFGTNTSYDLNSIEYIKDGYFIAVGNNGTMLRMQVPIGELYLEHNVFDKNDPTDLNGEVYRINTSFTGIKNGETDLVEGDDYTFQIIDDQVLVTIKKEYLMEQSLGTLYLEAQFSQGYPFEFEIWIENTEAPGNSSLNPTTAQFDKKTSEQADVSTTVTLNGNTLEAIKYGVTTLEVETHFTISDVGVVTFHKEYLATLPNGPAVFTFEFSEGDDQTLTVTISDTTTGNSSLNPTTAQFDKKTSAQADVTTTITYNENTLVDIFNVEFPLVRNTDYTLTEDGVVTIKKEYLATLPVGQAVLTFEFTEGDDQTLTITISDTTPSPQQPTPSSPSPTTGNVDVLVNGKIEKIGTATTGQRDNQSVTTIQVDEQQLFEKLEAEGSQAIVTIPVNSQSDVVVGELNGQMVKNMENKQAVLEIKTEKATYTLPAQQINIDSISDDLGTSVSLQDIKVRIEIAATNDEMVKVVENAAEQGEFSIVIPSLDFRVTAVYGNETIDVTKFNVYVERTIAVPDGVDPNKITTGVVVNPDGSVRHVPTKIVVIDGKYYAKVNSLTNSTYSIVWHPREFSDVVEHWAKDAVNDMGSRMVLEGTGNELFSPNQDITRAEFAAALVRGLGLKLENSTVPFSDVKASDWFSSAVSTAYSYDLIGGFEDGTFRPMEKITREQAMVILSNATEITGLKAKLSTLEEDEILSPFRDASEVSDWSKNSVALNLHAGIVFGRSADKLAPKAYMTRAEVAAIIQRLLQKSELI